MYSKSNNNYPYKVCVVTAARSEYGLLQWLMYSLQEDKRFCLQLIVTGAHLSTEQGLTYKQIEEDGFRIDEKIEMLLDSGTSAGIVKSTGLCAIGMADCLQRLKPDIIVVLGDRYELLPVCTSALLFNIPIAHISGGDITEGAIDNEIRNAVTMMSSLHFPEVESSANRIINMIGTEKNVYTVGETGLESFMRYSLITRSQLSADLNLSIESDWVLLTYHPETKLSIEQNLRIAENIITVLSSQSNTQVIITKSNADLGGTLLNSFWEKVTYTNPGKFTLFSSLGQQRYLSLMKEVKYMIGNSSSGIVEAPFIGIPVINIGSRQKGRHLCKNIISVYDATRENLIEAFENAKGLNRDKIRDDYYGTGNASSQIIEHLNNFLAN